MSTRNTQTLRARITADASDFNKKIEGIQGRMRRVGKGMQRTGKTMTKGVTAPILGVGAAALRTAGEFESSMNRVRAVSGATGEDFDKLEGLARELGSTTQFSAGQAADAMGFLAQAGFETDDMMSALPGTLDLAAAGQLELAQAADIASNVLTGFGMEAEEIGRVNDTLAATASNANTNVAQMGEAFSMVAPVANSSGMEIEETSAIIGALGDAGIQASKAGTTLRGMIASLESPSGQAAEAIEELGLNTHDASGELLPMTDIVAQLEEKGLSSADAMEIFGRRAGPGMAALVEQGSDKLAALTGKLQESGGTAERMAETQMEGLNGALARLKSALEGAAIAIAESGLIDKVAAFAEKVAGLFQRLAETNPKLLRMGVVIAGVVAAAGPLLVAGGALVTAIAALISPIGLVVAGLAGLAAAFTTAYKKSETFRDIVNGAFNAVKNVVGPTIGWLGDRLKDVSDFFGVTRTTVVDEVEDMSNKAVAETVDMTQQMTDQVRMLRNKVGGELSQEMADEWVANVNKMADDAIAAANEQYNEIRTGAQELADDLDTVTLDMAGDVVRNARQQRDKTIAANERARKEALDQIELLRSEGVKVTDKMAREIIAKFENQRTEVVKALADQERDAINVLSRLEAESGKISVRMASNAIKQSAKQRDKTVMAARDEYRDRVDAINQMAEESDEFTREMADEAIREARRQRDDSVEAARGQHQRTVGEIKEMRDGVENEVNLMNGNVLSSWDRFWRDFSERLNSGFSGFLIDSGKWLVSWDKDSSESIGGTLSGWSGKFSTWFTETLTSLGEWISDTVGRLGTFRESASRVWSALWSHLHERASAWMGAVGTVVKGKIDDLVGWFADLPGRITRALGNIGSKIKSAFSFDLSLGGEAGGPGDGAMPPGGSVISRLNSYMDSTGIAHRTTSTFRPGDPGFHGQGRAVDFAGRIPGRNTPNLRAIQRAWVPLAASGQLRELIGPDASLNFKNGRQGPGVYPPKTQEAHKNHVHTAMRAGGMIVEPIFGVGASGRTYSFGEEGTETVRPGRDRGGSDGAAMQEVVDELRALRRELGRPNVTLQSTGDPRDDAQHARLKLIGG